MNVLVKSAVIVDPKSDFHNQTVDILIEKGLISQISNEIKNTKIVHSKTSIYYLYYVIKSICY